MPVYMRAAAEPSNTPSTFRPLDSDDDDFLQDPEQLIDKLPQPFRFIDKTINRVFERAWDIVRVEEEQRVKQRAKKKVPHYEWAAQLSEYGPCSSLASSSDGRYVFIALPDSLVVMDTNSHQRITSWQEDNVHVAHIDDVIAIYNSEMYTVICIDDTGISRLFVFVYNSLQLVKVMNEPETGYQATKVSLSPQADHVAVALQGNGQSWLEINKIQRDVWQKEFDAAFQSQKSLEKQNSFTTMETADVDGEQQTGTESSPLPPPTISVTFTKPNLVLRIKPPSHVTATNNTSPSSKLSDDVIGTGTNHMLTHPNLELRQEMLNKYNEQLLKLKYEETDETDPITPCVPTFHFLTPGKLLPQGLEASGSPQPSTAVCVWWTQKNQLCHYSLIKPGKDVEHKPDVVWPNSASVTASSVTPCSTLISLGLENGVITVWDKQSGSCLRSMYLGSCQPVTELMFINPAALPTSRARGGVVNLNARPCLLMARQSNSRVTTVKIGTGLLQNPTVVIEGQDSDDSNHISITRQFSDLPQLMLVGFENGQLLIFDLVKGQQLCEIGFSQSFSLATPTTPCLATADGGRVLFIKASSSVQSCPDDDEGEGVVTEEDYTVFVYYVRSFPTLDTYWSQPLCLLPVSLHTTVDIRCQQILTNRLMNQSMRQERLKERWTQLKYQVEIARKTRQGITI